MYIILIKIQTTMVKNAKFLYEKLITLMDFYQYFLIVRRYFCVFCFVYKQLCPCEVYLFVMVNNDVDVNNRYNQHVL